MITPVVQHMAFDNVPAHRKIDPIHGNLKVYALNLAGFLFIYGYFASGFADDGATCLANLNCLNEKDEKRIDEDSDQADNAIVENESSNFQFLFLQLFILTVIQAVGLYYNHIFIEDDNKRAPVLYFCIFPSLLWYLVVWVFMFIERFSHRGKVCSGDYLGISDSEEGYLIDTGLFIIFIWRFISIALILGVVAGCGALAYIPLFFLTFERNWCTCVSIIATILIALCVIGGIYLCYWIW